jgi:hypothetical protein
MRMVSGFAAVTLGCGALLALTAPHGVAATDSWSSKVLLVGKFHGTAGQFKTIQAAVNAAQPGDWILVGPGDYKEVADETGPHGDPAVGAMGGVYITKSGITLRGMNRGTVIVDGTKQGSAPCSSSPSAQNYGAPGAKGVPVGRNGILIWKASGVSVENLTVCNFMAGTGASGNQVWWNGGDGSGKIGLSKYWGSYLTATSTFLKNEATAAEYGIFASNSAGPASLNQLYASNMNDSGTYVGACLQRCDVVMNHLWMENNALGYSGTNSGGRIVIENSQFDENQDGLDTNTAVVGDPPAPQNGLCPGGKTSPFTHTTSCWVVVNNYIHNNNNATAPAAGSAAGGPVGTGMTVSGGRFDTIMGNHVADNGAWGVLFIPYAQSGTPSLGQTCTGVGGQEVPGFGCVMDPMGDALEHNVFRHNGYFGNPSNSDFGQITLFGGEPANCYAGNKAPDGSAPDNLQKVQAHCGGTTKAGNTGGALFEQVLCDTRLSTCPAGSHYPTPGTKVVLKKLPAGLPTMTNPCAGVPANPWCPGPYAPGNGGGSSSGGAAAAAVTAAGVLAVPALRPRRRITAPTA